MDLGLRGRTALVTGSHRGTGQAIAGVLADEGAAVVVHGFERDPAEAVASSLRDRGGEARAVWGDLLTDAGAAAVADAAGPVDVLVNNYGTAERGDWSSSTDDWVDLYQKNVLSGVRMVHALVPAMRTRGHGRIVFVGTVGNLRPAARMPHYYGAKAALPAVVLSLAKELSGSGVTVNLVSPGLLATAEVRAGLVARAQREGRSTAWDDVARHAAEHFMPNLVGRVGEPEEVGRAVAFLASDGAGYVNGANLRIDGGSADVAL